MIDDDDDINIDEELQVEPQIDEEVNEDNIDLNDVIFDEEDPLE